MKELCIPHHWLFPSSLSEATKVQRELAENVIVEDQFSRINFIAGMDVSNNRFDPAQMIHAAAIVLDKNTLQVTDSSCVSMQQNFPYMPGFLGFREAPALVAAYQKLSRQPDVILVDGHGISHPRRLGIASHIGVLLNCPTIGVAKSILVGKISGALDDVAGAQAPLVWRHEKIAVVLRSKVRTLPLIISPGHKISLESAVAIVKSCLTRYRLPEPTRHAHLAANICRREFDKNAER